jgi:hypothetical protein
MHRIQDVSVLVLKRNLGHQRALCVGLCSIDQGSEWQTCQGVIVMDADGEDSPADVPQLVERYEDFKGTRPVFAQRLRRSEGLTFRVFYQLYRIIHRVLSGVSVQIGNFSVLPRETISRLSVVSELWNHYAAACVYAKLPIVMVPTTRGRRLAGSSRMNFVGLVGHGLSAMSVFGERIGARSLIAVVVTALILSVVIAIAGWLHLIIGIPLPGWGPLAAGILAILLMQALLLSLVFSFLTHSNRAGGGFLPARDCRWFVEREACVWSRDERI